MHKRGGRLRRIVVVFLLLITVEMVASAASLGDKLLKQGMRGEDVRELQKALCFLGYPTEADGIFGFGTRDALKQFQREAGLRADGIAGTATLQVIGEILSDKWYKVVPGDALSTIAKRYGTTVDVIMASNGMRNTSIKAGERLVLAAGSDLNRVYVVQRGDSLTTIAKRFGVSLERLLDVNDLEDPEFLLIGQKLLIPQQMAARHQAVSGRGAIPMTWPVTSRRITSGYGWRIHPIYKSKQFHGGIDIGVPTGTPVYAVAAGRVKDAGWRNGYGYAVVLDHGNSITSWYGHLSKILVKEGQRVLAGQKIAESGNTGVSTGPHLDFRIKLGEETVDPLKWLP